MNLDGTKGNYVYTPVDAFKSVLDNVNPDDLKNYSAAEIENLASNLKKLSESVTGTDVQKTDAKGIATFSDLSLGYYLVVETKAPASYVAGTPFLVAIPSTNNYNQDTSASAGTDWVYDVKVEAKNTQVNIEKKLADAEVDGSNKDVQDGSVKVGDYVKYVITTKIPEYSDEYTNAKFTINDIMSDGLKIQNEGQYLVTVKVDGTEVSASSDTYTITANNVTGDYKTADLVVAFASKYILENPNKKVEVTYYARVTDAAVTGTLGNPNKVKLDYNNKPGEDASAETPDIKVYSFNIQVEKFTNENGSNTSLSGAEFGLYSDETCTEQIGTAITNDSGILSFSKIDEGTYYLKETKSPAGYTLLTNPIKIEIIADEDATGKATGNFTLKVDGQKITNAANTIFTTRLDQASGTAYVAVENHKGFSLPATGGAGIALFLIIGAAGIIVVSVAFTKKSRKAN